MHDQKLEKNDVSNGVDGHVTIDTVLHMKIAMRFWQGRAVAVRFANLQSRPAGAGILIMITLRGK